MATSRPLRLAAEWDERFVRMVAVSAVAHGIALVAILIMIRESGMRPVPPVAYTVELTDPSALGGRVPPGLPAHDLAGGDIRPLAPEPKGESPAPPAPAPEVKPEPQPEPKAEAHPVEPEAPAVRIAEKPKPPEPKPEPKKVEPPKPEAKKPEAPKPEARKPEPPKAETKKPEPPKPAAAPTVKPAATAIPTVKPGTPAGAENAPPRDAYAAAAERWRARAGGGLGGTDEGTGPIGSGGEGRGGGGEVVGLEFIAYKQQVINAVRASWTNLIGRPGLVAVVTFEIGPDGEVSNARLTQSSGNSAYDASAVRAVQHTTRLPPPPARYVKEFREFIMRFNSEDPGGQGAG